MASVMKILVYKTDTFLAKFNIITYHYIRHNIVSHGNSGIEHQQSLLPNMSFYNDLHSVYIQNPSLGLESLKMHNNLKD